VNKHHKATEEEDDLSPPGKEIWKNVDSSYQVHLEKDGGGSIRQKWAKK